MYLNMFKSHHEAWRFQIKLLDPFQIQNVIKLGLNVECLKSQDLFLKVSYFQNFELKASRIILVTNSTPIVFLGIGVLSNFESISIDEAIRMRSKIVNYSTKNAKSKER